MTLTEFESLATERFGPERMDWKFVCPCCGFVQTAHDYKAAGAPPGAVAFSCVGRWSGAKREAFGKGKGPCNYAGGGLIGMHKITVDGQPCFELAEAESIIKGDRP